MDTYDQGKKKVLKKKRCTFKPVQWIVGYIWSGKGESLKNIIANKVKNVLLHKSSFIMDTNDQGKGK